MPPDCADMAGRRIAYLAILGLCILFDLAYGQWLSWILLLTLAGLPWFSLVLSLPAILRFRAMPDGPKALTMGQSGQLWLLGSCPLPMPLFQGKLRITRLITGERWLYQDTRDLETHHCGGLAVTAEKVKICDYLGLFAFPVHCREGLIIPVRPLPLAMKPGSDPDFIIPRAWKPKFGGGYAENHELRLYRPGDSLNQVHWKLSAKTGSLILREPMEPRQGRILLTMHLRGTHQELDRKFGRLLWLGNRLLSRSLGFEIRVLTEGGVVTHTVSCPEELTRAIDDLLCRGAAGEGDLRQQACDALWHCHIGGEPDEA